MKTPPWSKFHLDQRLGFLKWFASYIVRETKYTTTKNTTSPPLSLAKKDGKEENNITHIYVIGW